MKLTLTIIIAIAAMIAAVEAMAQTVIDFTTGLPAGVEPKQASGSVVHYPAYKCAHVYGEWMLPITIQPGERVEIDLNPRYETAGGVMVNGVRKPVTRYTVSPVVITATGTIGLYGGSVGTDNRVQWRQVRYWPNPTPRPTETPSPTATPSPTPTVRPTIDFTNWTPVWMKIKDSQDVVLWERWLVEPGTTMYRVDTATIYPATVDLRVPILWVGEGVLQEQSE